MNAPHADIREVLSLLLGGGVLDEPLAERVFELILTGQVNEAQLGAMLAFISARGAETSEIVAGVRVLRRHMIPVRVGSGANGGDAEMAGGGAGVVVLDTCGTGGGPKVFNVSTVAAFVVAAAGRGRILVAKHGGRSRTGRGSAEVLEALGVNINATPEVQARCLEETGISFSFAPLHHPAMRFAAGSRKSLGFPTIFNLIGPLSNPAGATHQLVGTFDPVVARSLAAALHRLGTTRAMIVTSRDGMDELTTTEENEVLDVSAAGIVERTLDARELGLARRGVEELRADSLEEAARVFVDVLAGRAGAAREIVELNAAAALVLGGVAGEMAGGLVMAREAIDSGGARGAFEGMREGSNR